MTQKRGIKIVGVGHAGCLAVKNLSEKGIGNVSYGEIRGREDENEIREIIGEGTNTLIIVSGFGLITGTEKTPMVAKIAREMEIFTVGVVTLPFTSEGTRRSKRACAGIDATLPCVDGLLVINSDNLIQQSGFQWRRAFDYLDEEVAMSVENLVGMLDVEKNSYQDLTDLYMTLRSGKRIEMGTGEGESEGRVTKALDNATEALRRKDVDMDCSDIKKMLVTLYVPKNEALTLEELYEVEKYLHIEERDYIFWRCVCDVESVERLKVNIIVSTDYMVFRSAYICFD